MIEMLCYHETYVGGTWSSSEDRNRYVQVVASERTCEVISLLLLSLIVGEYREKGVDFMVKRKRKAIERIQRKEEGKRKNDFPYQGIIVWSNSANFATFGIKWLCGTAACPE
jgi:hypothetical protein